MYCPKCKCEYREGFTECADCHVELVEQLEIPEQPKAPEPFDCDDENCKPVKLTNVSNEIDAQLVLNMLKNNNIPCFVKRKFSGGYMQVYMGFSVFGEDIFVSERDYNTAMDLLPVMLASEGQNEITDKEIIDNEIIDKESSSHIPFYMDKRILLIIFRIIFFGSLGLSILALVITNIINR